MNRDFFIDTTSTQGRVSHAGIRCLNGAGSIFYALGVGDAK
ncbi:hypothetical protein NT01EI_3784 [Edwardsiella ictaluri 93-146]|uniref:Uncharacterized protein n=1 Tax=Edwardsiella ictaluri (strain 93-146) TaxID=634503 RepID=C5BB67_EDWI9|nr:hypothetical protein NT01EI_3784 [Edwardsiella ictaluri 93-146]